MGQISNKFEMQIQRETTRRNNGEDGFDGEEMFLSNPIIFFIVTKRWWGFEEKQDFGF